MGGCVRDHLLGRPIKDWDLEVFGVPQTTLERALRRLGRVDAVGKSFGVFKSRPRGWTDDEIDVAIPRRDSKVGPGHRGISVEGDPDMPLNEAARRRDLTINAILFDLETDTFVDPWGGRDDIMAKRLRAVDDSTFLEDPLRALRAVQFTARLGFAPTPSLTALCRAARLDELPAERIQGEWGKLLVKGTHIAQALVFAREANILQRVFPEAASLDDPTIGVALEAALPARDELDPPGRKWALLLSVWLRGAPANAVEATLDRLWIHKVGRYDARTQTLSLVANPVTGPLDAAALRHLSTHCQVDLALAAARAHGVDVGASRETADALGVLTESPPPFLSGRDLLAAGHPPGPAIGERLREVYSLQLDGLITSREQALALL
ncbi:MAG: tRNA nucleotidyltransferase (CCA-adding enzyme) [Myxococcota bacterium]